MIWHFCLALLVGLLFWSTMTYVATCWVYPVEGEE